MHIYYAPTKTSTFTISINTIRVLRRYKALGRDLDERSSWWTWHPDKQQLIEAGRVRQHVSTAVLATDASQTVDTPLAETYDIRHKLLHSSDGQLPVHSG